MNLEEEVARLNSELDAFKSENIELRKVWGQKCEELTAFKYERIALCKLLGERSGGG